MTRGLAVAVVMVAGCAGDKDAPRPAPAPARADACGPLRVSLAGTPLTGLGAAYGVRRTEGTATVWHVETADGAPLSCEEVLRGGRAVRAGAHVVAADIASDRTHFTGVRVDAHMVMAFDRAAVVHLDGAPPTKVGDPIAICVDTDPVRTVAHGVEIHGALRGTYCGER